MQDLLTPKDAASALGLSVATITRCVKRGAPVHRWGSTGRRYRIDVDEFRRWMERQGSQKTVLDAGRIGGFLHDVDELARRRRASVRGVI
jgi:excisionase family DNA binding protein